MPCIYIKLFDIIVWTRGVEKRKGNESFSLQFSQQGQVVI